MKKNLAKILVLVLLVSLFVPSWANAGGDTYTAKMTLTDGTNTATAAIGKYLDEGSKLTDLYAEFEDLYDKAQYAFPGSGLGSTLKTYLDAVGTADWANLAADGITYSPEAAGAYIQDPSNSTIGDLVALGTTITAKKTLNNVEYTLTLTLSAYVAPAPAPVNPAPSASAAPSDEPKAEVEGNNVTVSRETADAAEETGKAVVIPETFKSAAADAEDAQKINIDIPEDAGNVRIVLPVENLTDSTVVVLVKADGTEEILPKTAVTDEGLLISLDKDATIKIIDNPVNFDDVKSLSKAEQDAVAFVAARKLFNGIFDDVFAPEQTMNRYMFATVIHRLEGEPKTSSGIKFDDVQSGKWYSDAVAWAAEKGIIFGYSDTEFGGTDPVTREQIALMLWRYCGKPAATATSTSAHKWAADAMSWAVANGVFAAGTDAQGNATRLDVAVALKNFINLIQGADMNLA